ncbi:MAG: hypothetical protein HZB70_00965 [Candidatus Berkelbacteria bacterium]|nr:MAG: hypothetical protein HZB70_00965 [Candidatus Berkelbacteria bacterium]QQG52090.1 MAG: hypothetical protein HY845_02030 [Candidatus Berkelbacteria bacterium]
MKVKFFGTRGSIPVCGKEMNGYGGNTTCLQVESSCLPDGFALVVDGGSGFMPLSSELLQKGIYTIHMLLSHHHHDHTQGILLSPAVYSPKIRFELYGPVESGIGPKQMMQHIMRPPFHPVSFKLVSNRFSCHSLDTPQTNVIVFHPEGGVRKVGVEVLDGVEGHRPSQIRLGGGFYDIRECLVVRMARTEHPERTISYRFEERPTNKVFVFLTDHENTDGVPVHLRPHLMGVDLLVMDSQYSRETYDRRTSGFGHGTPDYCVKVARTVGAKKLGLTHHDPLSTDEMINAMLAEARESALSPRYTGKIFACRDYQEVEV